MEAADFFHIPAETMTAFVDRLGGAGRGHGTPRAAEALNLRGGPRQIQRILLGERIQRGEVQGYNREGKPITWDGKGTVYHKDGREMEARGMGKAVREQLQEAIREAGGGDLAERILRDGVTVTEYSGAFDYDGLSEDPTGNDQRKKRTINRPEYLSGEQLKIFVEAARQGNGRLASDAFNEAFFTQYAGLGAAEMSRVDSLHYRIGR